MRRLETIESAFPNVIQKLLPRPERAYAPGSLPTRLRARRFALFSSLLQDWPRPLHIIDVGGTNDFWEHQRWAGRDDIRITLVNLQPEPARFSNIVSIDADATDLHAFQDRSFDVAFSNSAIEHLYTFRNQQRMAAEIRRLAKGYWVQTPNYWFPIEPHFQFLAWHWLPIPWRVEILRRRTCGWRGQTPDPARARKLVEEVRLLCRRELHELFPDAALVPERFLGLVKSWIAVGGRLRSAQRRAPPL